MQLMCYLAVVLAWLSASHGAGQDPRVVLWGPGEKLLNPRAGFSQSWQPDVRDQPLPWNLPTENNIQREKIIFMFWIWRQCSNFERVFWAKAVWYQRKILTDSHCLGDWKFRSYFSRKTADNNSLVIFSASLTVRGLLNALNREQRGQPSQTAFQCQSRIVTTSELQTKNKCLWKNWILPSTKEIRKGREESAFLGNF